MIKEINELDVINEFLKHLNTSINNLEDPFKKYIGFEIDNKIVSFLNYSLIDRKRTRLNSSHAT